MAEENIEIRGRRNKLMVGKSNVLVDNESGAEVKVDHPSSSTQSDLRRTILVDGEENEVMRGDDNTYVRIKSNTDRTSPGDVSHHGEKTHVTAGGTRRTSMRDPRDTKMRDRGGTTIRDPRDTKMRDRGGTTIRDPRDTKMRGPEGPHITEEPNDLVKEDDVPNIHFRKEVEGKLVQIGNCCTIVDIRIDDQAMDRLASGGELAGRFGDGKSITFTWESSEMTIKRNIHFKVSEVIDNIYDFLLAGFKEDDFCFSRKMVQDIFKEYKATMNRIFFGSIVIEVAHASQQSVQDMESRPGPLINMFKDFVFRITKCKVEVEISFESVPACEPMPRSRHALSTTEAIRTQEQEDNELYCLSDDDNHNAKEADQFLQATQIKSILDSVRRIQKQVHEVCNEGAPTAANVDAAQSYPSDMAGLENIPCPKTLQPGIFQSAVAAAVQEQRHGNAFVRQSVAEPPKASMPPTEAEQEGTSRHLSDVGPTPAADLTDPHPTGGSDLCYSTAAEQGSVTHSATSTGGAKPKVKGVSTNKLMTLARSALKNYSEADLMKIEKSVQLALEDDLSPRAHSLGTILCLDCSQSMTGDAFRQMKDIAETFISGIEDVAENDNMEENVAVVSVSGRARVVQQLTNDYSKVRDALETLKPEGRSPLFEMLIVAMAASQGKGGVLKVYKHLIRPRIIVITDGKLTDEKQDSGPDIQSDSAKVPIIRLITELGSKKHKTTPSPIVWIPVGDADKDLLNSLAKLGNGQVAEAKDLPKLIRYYKIQDSIGKIYACVHSNIEVYPDVQQAIKHVARGIAGEVNPSDIDEIVAVVRNKIASEKGDMKPDDFDNVYENPELEPLGSRVMRDKDLQEEDQHSQDVGTIINHDESENWVWVLWDSGSTSRHRSDLNSVFDVVPVDGHPRVPTEQFLQIGVRVKRGQGWESKNYDGGEGNTGVVIRTRGDQEVKVRWSNGNIKTHKFGLDGVYELEICNPLFHKKQTDGERMFPGRPRDTGLGSPHAEEEEDSRPAVWRWHDGHQWRLYQDDLQVKIHQEYKRKKDGTCLVKKRDGSYRIYFKSMQEKSLQENIRHDVQRLHVDNGELANLKVAESLQD
ncbi:uncharacterized protein [Haliotis asinina]|uniref:uncharacterized protein n=1 Tax=Haliotis asinina TaxID=109174 RepID=UPI00353268FD